MAGEWLPGQKLPSTRSAGRQLNVHHLTVGEAYRRLAADGLVKLRARVGAFVADRPKGSELLICTRHFENAYSHAAMVAAAIARHSHIRDHTISSMVVHADQAALLKALKTRADRGFLHGVWIAALPPALVQSAVNLLSSYEIPVVHISSRPHARYSVSIDTASAIRMGTRHLIEQGCRRVAFLSFGLERFGGQAEAFRATCEALGVHHEILTMPYDDNARLGWFERYGSHVTQELFARHLRPDGLLIGDDWIGRGALTALLRLDVSVPDEVRICTHARVGSGYPDSFGMPVARLELDDAEVAEAACRMMEQIIAKEELKEPHQWVKLRLVPAEVEAVALAEDRAPERG